jgi:hypothetical protein
VEYLLHVTLGKVENEVPLARHRDQRSRTCIPQRLVQRILLRIYTIHHHKKHLFNSPDCFTNINTGIQRNSEFKTLGIRKIKLYRPVENSKTPFTKNSQRRPLLLCNRSMIITIQTL